ncbi:PVC-type heme-binding CxxCH protein [Compostibacter hankyongensis]|uniref:Cytochrome c domain-containing protein n=1 Tax=Compostibacter hankyongensis TaxID=1007089 RepID=A0ABP8FJE4_9BACT
MKQVDLHHLRFSSLIVCLAVLSLASCKQAPPAQHPEKLPDEQQRLAQNALKGLQIDEGLYATLFASEPMITNPTNMDIDARGRVWICEGFNYRPQYNPGHPVKEEGDKILILEDTDGDGAADTSKTFYQGMDVNAALGICVLGNRVIISCSPKVFILTDTDGDDKADKKEVLFEGIAGEQHDHGIHAFTFGPDGKLYFNFGNAGDSILDKNGDIAHDIEGIPINNHGKPYREGMVFRCDPDGSNIEVLGHNFRNNYEVAVDAFGNLWQSDNDDDGNRGVRINYVMQHGNYGYTDEMTGANWRTPRVNMEDSIPYRHWHLNDPGVVPNLLQTGAGSPTGMLVYEGDLLPAVFRNQIIHADALPNVVRSYPVEKNGAGYTAKIVNIVEGIYDKWFRPSDVCVAPDGSLFIADWYDPGVGGHQVGDLEKGRIYRIAPPGTSYTVAPPELGTPEDAVKALESPNLATRYLAWERLHGWGEKAVPALEKMFKSDNPRYQARALWLLSKLPSKGMQYIQEALRDKDEDIRITAIRAAQELRGDITAVVKQVLRDPSAQVRRTAAIALRHSRSPQAPALWSALAAQYDGKDRWYLEALGIGADRQWDSYLAAWLRQMGNEWNSASGRDIVWRARTPAALPLLTQIIENPRVDPEQNLKFFRALDFYPDPDKQRVLNTLLQGHHPKQSFIDAIALLQMDPDQAPRTAAFRERISRSLQSVQHRKEFIQLVEKYHIRDQGPQLLDMALTVPSEEMRMETMETLLNTGGENLVRKKLRGDTAAAHNLITLLGHSRSQESKDLLLSLLLDKSSDPGLRKLATKEIGRGRRGEDILLKLMDTHKLPHLVDTVAADVLLHAYRDEVREKAEAYFHTGSGAKSALPPIASLAGMKGDAGKGKEVFLSYCSTCHMAAGQGTDFGPNLSEIGGKLAKEAIYKSIITPDAGISFGYEGYTFTLKDGKTVLGYISSETPEEVDVKMIGGTVEKIPAKNVAARKAYDHSLMPTGLASSMPQDQLVNLVEYLSTLKKKQ